jgi:protein-L-isoaspartate(D-aspartate) O-methyltransferase
MPERDFDAEREQMVRRHLEGRDITDPLVLEAMRRVPRHLFVPEKLREYAYEDRPLPIGHGQTISQPYIVALMTQLARPAGARRALDVGSGCGYQTAVLARIVPQVFALEIVPELAEGAEKRLRELGVKGVQVRCGDGYEGWPEEAPFDLILVGCAPSEPPAVLIEQLAPGGRLVLPVGSLGVQELVLIEKQADGSTHQSNEGGVAFVPMLRRGQQRH